MKIANFVKTWRGAIWENYWNRVLNIALIIILGLAVVKISNNKPVVVLQPPGLTEEATVAHNSASQNYRESWAMYLATLLGNVTPGSVDLVKKSLGPLLSPDIYQQVIDVLEEQAQQIEDDNIKRRFEPKYIEIEDSSGKMFIYGYAFTKTLNGEEDRTEFTFEFIIDIKNHRPVVSFIDAYSDRPHNERVLSIIKRREKAKEERKEREANQ